MTPAGLRQLKEEIGALEEHRLERSAGDDDDELLAREALALVDRDLRYYTQRLRSAIPVDLTRQPRRMVKFGATVLWRRPAGDRRLTIEAID